MPFVCWEFGVLQSKVSKLLSDKILSLHLYLIFPILVDSNSFHFISPSPARNLMEEDAHQYASSDSYLNQLSSYLPDVADLGSYLPDQFQTRFPVFQPPEENPNVGRIRSCSFEILWQTRTSGEELKRDILVFGYDDGFQIWDITDVNHFEEVRTMIVIGSMHYNSLVLSRLCRFENPNKR